MIFPSTKHPTCLDHFGYQFDQHQRLTKISDGSSFTWISQKHYDKLGDCLINHIYSILENKYNLTRVALPLDATKVEAQCPVFVSSDFYTAHVSILVCQGSGAVRPGMWARALCVNESLEVGSIFSYLDKIKQRGWGVMVLNPNENSSQGHVNAEPSYPSSGKGDEESLEEYWVSTTDAAWKNHCRKIANSGMSIRGNESPEKHMLYVWDNFAMKRSGRLTPIIAHSYGGIATTSLIRNRYDQVNTRIPCIAFTDALIDMSQRDTPNVIEFITSKTVNWVASDAPLDTELECKKVNGCVKLSAGHVEHEWTSSACVESVFRFFDNICGEVNST
eukprot:GHVN01086630.1.p1 GENE.GHVN01086630.1~~GHVN01086630.1.p1  ORF type:complete len:333 (-),score=63.14 GHVN01086630.1:35-1033(-)